MLAEVEPAAAHGAGLSPDQRECVVLRFLLNQSIAATVEAMSRDRGAIKALQYRALRTLHQRLPAGLR